MVATENALIKILWVIYPHGKWKRVIFFISACKYVRMCMCTCIYKYIVIVVVHMSKYIEKETEGCGIVILRGI